jgi:2-oxoglutarate dehydrogenase complex dehydrogenase (E1) component-like enzyme
MSVLDVDGLNVGYAQALLEQYLENPEAVPEEWRSLFESGDPAIVNALPGLARLVENLKENGAPAQAEAPPEPAPTQEPVQVTAVPPAPPEPAADDLLIGGVAAAMALIKAIRMHGHLAANLDPLGSDPVGDPALEAELLEPPLTPELQARRRSPTSCRSSGRSTAGPSLLRSSTSRITRSGSGSATRSSPAATASR